MTDQEIANAIYGDRNRVEEVRNLYWRASYHLGPEYRASLRHDTIHSADGLQCLSYQWL